jgi:hypothetical protein
MLHKTKDQGDLSMLGSPAAHISPLPAKPDQGRREHVQLAAAYQRAWVSAMMRKLRRTELKRTCMLDRYS